MKLATKLKRNFENKEKERIETANINRAIATKKVDDESAAKTELYKNNLTAISDEFTSIISSGEIPTKTILDKEFATWVNDAVGPINEALSQYVWDDFVQGYKDEGIAVVVSQGKRRTVGKIMEPIAIISLRLI